MCSAAVPSVPWVKHFVPRKTILLLFYLGFTIMIYLFYNSEIFTDENLDSYKELKYSQPFQYPLVFEDFPRTIEMFRTRGIEDTKIQPVNPAFMSTAFLQGPDKIKTQIKDPMGLLIIVKSARENVEKRKLVRKTWGEKDYLKEAVLSKDRPTKVFFICGTENASASDFSNSLTEEIDEFQDIILADFVDSYHNNTFKSVLALKWSVLYGGDYQYLALVDDDIHLDIINLCNYLRNLIYERVHVVTNNSTGYSFLRLTHRKDEDSVRISNLDHGLMIGHAKWDDPVIRDKKGGLRRWHVSYEEYPYNKYPPYHPGAGIIFDHRAAQDLYYGSLFVKYYRMDDVFLGIVAAKLRILILDCRDIQTDPKVSASRSNDVIIVHGLNPAQLQAFWMQRDFNKIS